MLSAWGKDFDARQFVAEHHLDWRTKVLPDSSGPVHNLLYFAPPGYCDSSLWDQYRSCIYFSHKFRSVLAVLRKRADRVQLRLFHHVKRDAFRPRVIESLALPGEFISAAAELGASVVVIIRFEGPE